MIVTTLPNSLIIKCCVLFFFVSFSVSTENDKIWGIFIYLFIVVQTRVRFNELIVLSHNNNNNIIMMMWATVWLWLRFDYMHFYENKLKNRWWIIMCMHACPWWTWLACVQTCMLGDVDYCMQKSWNWIPSKRKLKRSFICIM